MTQEEAFDIFCDEAKITDPITRELQVRPIFMDAWEISKENQRKIDIEKACDFMRNFTLLNGVAPLYDYTGNLRKAMEE